MYLVFTKHNCASCEKAKLLLNSKQIPYTWINIEEMPEMIPIVKSLGVKTMPAIFSYEGGYDNLEAELMMKENPNGS